MRALRGHCDYFQVLKSKHRAFPPTEFLISIVVRFDYVGEGLMQTRTIILGLAATFLGGFDANQTRFHFG